MSSSLRFIFRYIFSERRIFFLGILMTAGVSLSTWFGPRIIARIIDQGIIPGNKALALKLVVILALVELSRLLCSVANQVCYSVLGQNVIEKIRSRMIHHLLSLPVPYFDRVTSGGIMTRVVSDANSLTDFFQSGFVSVLGNLGTLCAAFVGLYGLNHRLGLLLFFTFVPFAFLCAHFSIRLKKVYEETRLKLSELNSILADFLFGMKTIRALGVSKRCHTELVERVDQYANTQMRMVRTFALFHPTVTLGVGLMLLLLIGIGLPLVNQGELAVGAWVAALSYVILMQQPLVEISDRWNFFLAGMTSVERVEEVLREVSERSGGGAVDPFHSIVFDEVSFRYKGEESKALDSISLRVEKGDWIGIYGESGSGKSTFLQMLYGFYQAESGSVLWNGKAISELDLTQLRSNFGVVEQFPFLFVGTIEENITFFGKFPFNRIELIERFKGFSLIQSILEKSDFVVFERGSNLSMGQKQMITFLRAYLSEPAIWILDEATAFFDTEAERELLKALENLKAEGITVIQVAHRPEALSHMKRLVNVRQGHLQELVTESQKSSPRDLP